MELMHLDILNLLLVLVVALLAGFVARRLGYPAVLGELLAGVLLGPPLLGLLHSDDALRVLAEIGLLLMMFYIGLEMRPRELQHTAKAGLLAAAGGFVVPFALCYLAVVYTGSTVTEALFVGLAVGTTSLATKSRVLLDLDRLGTRIAHVMMGGTLAADVAALVLFTTLLTLLAGNAPNGEAVLLLFVKMGVFFGIVLLLRVRAIPWFGKQLEMLKKFQDAALFTLVLILLLLFAVGAEWTGFHGMLGAFLAGLVLSEGALGHALSRTIREKVRSATLGFLAPVFFVTVGFAVSFDVLRSDPALVIGIIVLATLGKVVGTVLFYLPTGYGWREGLAVGLGMNGRGAIEIIMAQVALGLGLIAQDLFSVLVLLALSTMMLEPFLLKWGVDWLGRREELAPAGRPREGTLIVGAGPVARALAGVLARTEPVFMVDRSKEHCRFAENEGRAVICGDALDEEVLAQAGAARVNRFIALTPNAEVNTLAADLARTVFHVPEVLVPNLGDPAGHAALLDAMQAHTLFGGAVALDDWDYRVAHETAGRAGFPVLRPLSPRNLFRTLQEEGECLPLALLRGNIYLPFHSGLKLQEDDRLIVFREPEVPYIHYDRFDKLVWHCPILDLNQRLSMPEFLDLAARTLAPRLGLEANVLAKHFLDREATSSTVLLPGLAIPHALVEGEGQFEMLIARCREGIVAAGQPDRIHAAFVLVSTPDQRNFHLRALSAIAQMAQWSDFEQSWFMAPGAEGLRRLIVDVPRRRLSMPSNGHINGLGKQAI